jgi:membrane associated rhomboid family serine protease/Zn-finger nucleic acid-binding protein
MFTCPNCHGILANNKNDLGIFWICSRCGGRAVSLTVLRRAIGQGSVNRLWSAARDGHGIPSRNCPTCARQMLEVNAPTAEPIRLDVCRTCQFAWFDPAEFEQMPQPAVQTQAAPSPALPEKARQAAALLEVKRISEEAARGPDGEMPVESWKHLPALFGLPVECDTSPLRSVPWLTWSVTALICVISIAAFSNLRHAIHEFGLIPAEVWRDHGLTMITSFFLHGSVFHLVTNVYFLLVFGDNVEDYLGRWRWLLLLFGAAIAGDVGHVLANPTSTVPCVGASGGISGVIAFYALKFPHARLGFMWGRWWYYSWVTLPAWGAFALWTVLQVAGAGFQLAGMSAVSAFAHLGGAAMGLLFWSFWRTR